MEPSVAEQWLRIITPLGIGGVLAVMMFLLYRKDSREDLKIYQEHVREITAALNKSSETHERSIEESSRNRQLFLDLREELRATRSSIFGGRRTGDRIGDPHDG